MTEQNCGKCRFYFKEDGGLCRRFPPAVHVEQLEADQVKVTSAFPAMKPMGWCGEFKYAFS
jgi:hypothetical protein